MQTPIGFIQHAGYVEIGHADGAAEVLHIGAQEDIVAIAAHQGIENHATRHAGKETEDVIGGPQHHAAVL